MTLVKSRILREGKFLQSSFVSAFSLCDYLVNVLSHNLFLLLISFLLTYFLQKLQFLLKCYLLWQYLSLIGLHRLLSMSHLQSIHSESASARGFEGGIVCHVGLESWKNTISDSAIQQSHFPVIRILWSHGS